MKSIFMNILNLWENQMKNMNFVSHLLKFLLSIFHSGCFYSMLSDPYNEALISQIHTHVLQLAKTKNLSILENSIELLICLLDFEYVKQKDIWSLILSFLKSPYPKVTTHN